MYRTSGFRLAFSVLLAAFCTTSFTNSTGFAASPPQIPAQNDPGLVIPGPNDQLREERQKVEEKQVPYQQEQPPQVDLSAPTASGTVEIEATTFTVKQILIEDSTLLTEEQIQAITQPDIGQLIKLADTEEQVRTIMQPYIGQQVTLADLERIVEQITAIYRDQGYLTTQAYIPPQEVTDGVIRIRVVEGRIGKVSIIGNKHYKAKVIERNLKLRSGELFDIKALEKNMHRSNQANRFVMRAVLSPGEQIGTTDVRIEMQERQPWQITPTVDNQGRPFIGMYQMGAEISNDSLLGYGDRLLTKEFFSTEGTQAFLTSYYLPLNSHGDELGFNFGYSHVDVDLDAVNPPDIDGIAHSLGLSFVHPFDADRVFVGDIGIQGRRIRSFVNDDRDNLDEIRSIGAGLTFNKVDRLGRTFARGQLSTGLDVFGGNAQFFKTELFATRLFRLPLGNILILRGYGQYSPDALPSAEAFQLGGAYSVRGFTEGVLIGDRGYNFTIEDRWPIPFLSRLSPWLADRLQGALFFDIGQTWLDKSNSRFVPGVSHKSRNTLLVGTGIGLRARLTQYLQGFLDLGFGLVDRSAVEPTANPTARIHFGIRSNLLSETFQPPDPNAKPTYLQAGRPQAGIVSSPSIPEIPAAAATSDDTITTLSLTEGNE